MQKLQIEPLPKNQKAPFDLLLLADPSKELVSAYLRSGTCYIVKLGSEQIGAMVLVEIDSSTIEIKNIAIKESVQGKGFGKVLLRYASKISHDRGFKKVIIRTGNSSIGQLALYQKEGFEIQSIENNFFVKNYKEPIFENGIQCKHMIILGKSLNLKAQ